MNISMLLLALASLALFTQASGVVRPDPPNNCSDCAEWNKPHDAFRVFGNTYYVGTGGLSSVLIESKEGLILIDGGLPQTAPLIDQGIRKLGFRTADIRLILNSHAHYDHAGGIAAIQRATGASVAAGPAGARALAQGGPTTDDPQYGFGVEANAYPKVANTRAVKDGEVLRVGELAVTAHLTPGHTPGGATWSWRSCEGATCKDIVYADSLTAVAAPNFRYSEDPKRVAAFRHSIAKVAALPCDILFTSHPAFNEQRSCRSYAANAEKALEKRLAEEKKD
jgi:metallo-beta-lactamase class B